MKLAMKISLATLAAVVAALLAAEDAPPIPGFDISLGIWFPPNAAEEVYLDSSEPQHNFSTDVRAAFQADPALRERVCELLGSPRYAVSGERLTHKQAQMHTMETMMCLSLKMKDDNDRSRQSRVGEATSLLKGWFDEDLASATQLPAAERRRREYDLRNSVAELPAGTERARVAMQMVALRPSDDLAIFYALKFLPEARLKDLPPGSNRFRDGSPGGLQQAVGAEMTRRFLSTAIEERSRSSAAFGQALAAFALYTGGDLSRARTLADSFADDSSNDNRDYTSIFSAVLGWIAGDRAPLSKMMVACPFSSREAIAGKVSNNYCHAIAWSIARRVVSVRGKDCPGSTVDLLAALIKAEPTNWGYRMDIIRSIETVDPARATNEFQAVLALPATAIPMGARLDAMTGVTNDLVRQRRFGDAVAAVDFWLATIGYEAHSLPKDGWKHLSLIQTPPGDENVLHSSGECDPVACALAWKMTLELDVPDLAASQRTAEKYLAYTIEAGRAEGARHLLLAIAIGQHGAGHTEAARRILAYLHDQPLDPVGRILFEQNLKGVGATLETLGTADSPWDEPAHLNRSPERQVRK